ncbi:hypothetical protein DFH09DRAFT_1099852 [Mycena vulgaris]|nr:hypothetical protein DFH09DRAFT_1099852 [Mycena vulgaris]
MKPFAGQQAVKLEDVECNGQGKVIALNRVITKSQSKNEYGSIFGGAVRFSELLTVLLTERAWGYRDVSLSVTNSDQPEPLESQPAARGQKVRTAATQAERAADHGDSKEIKGLRAYARGGTWFERRGTLDVTESGKTKMINGGSEVDVSGEDGEEGELVSELARGLGCRSFHPGKDSTSVFPQRNGLPSWEMTEVSWTGRSGGMTGSAVMQR